MLDIPLNLSPRYQVTLTLSADDGQNLNLSADPADLLLQAAAVLRGEQGPAYPSEAAQAATEAARDAAIAAQTTAEGAADDAGAAATAASGYAATASGHAATASGYATDASDSATDAAASAGAASTSAGTATTQAGAAASSAASASASAATATTKAGEAAASAASAAGAVATALTAHTAAADPHPGYALDADLTAGLATKLTLTGGTLSGWLKMAVGSGHYLYNLDTDASNYERLSLGWASAALRINAEAAGTGAQRHIGLQTAGGNVGVGTASPTRNMHIEGTFGLSTASGGGIYYDPETGTLVIQQKPGKSGNLLEFRNASGVLNAYINRDGAHLGATFFDTTISLRASGYFEGSGFWIDSRLASSSGLTKDVMVLDPAFTNTKKQGSASNRGAATLGVGGWVNAPLWMHFRGAAYVNADSGAIAIGDRLVMSPTLDGAVCADNSGNLSLSLVGYALSSKAAGSTGQVDVWVVPVQGVPNVKTNGYTELTEMAAPAAPATNDVRIYAEDNGAGKTRLMARFATGAAVQIAIEP